MFDNTSNENLSNKGIQVDLGEYLEYKKQFNDTRTISYSSSDLYHKRKKEQEEARSDFFIYGGASAVSAKVLYEKAKKDEGIRALISEVPGAKLLKQKLTKQYLDNQAAQIISGAIDPRSTAVAPLSQSLQSILVSLEELSPSQILKTLQLSSFNSLFVEVIDEERKKARHIKQTSIQVYENYYKNLIFKESKIKLMDEDIKHGFILQNNKLYQAVPVAGNKGEVKAGRVLLDYATVVNSTIKTGDNHHSVNRVFEKFSNIYDANLNRSQLHTEPFVIVGGASKKSTVATWAKAYGRFSLEIGAKSLDNPLGFLEEYLDMTGLNNSKLVKNKYFQTAKGFTNFKLGTGGVYNISSAEMMKKIGKNLAIKGAAGVVGLNIIDATLDALTPDSSVWSSGLVAGMADTFMKAHVKFAELWSDNFQDLKKSQENSAPESTKLSTLIGVPLAGAMTGANLALFKRMRDTATKGLEQSSTIHTAEQKLGGLLGKAADKVGINIVGNTLSRYSKVGALLGATLTLPFLPGALVGKSSEELRQEYSGEKEVAVRKDRGWLCMTPDTPIFSSVGYSRAEDIKTGDFLYNRYGTKNKVISVHKRYTKELAYEFKTAYSTNLWTTVTADHKVLTSNGWVPANKINVGDYVVTGIPKLNINSKLLDLASYVNTEKHITETAFFSKQKTRNPAVTVTGKNILCNRYIKIDYQFGLFLGWFLAEGCVSRDKNGKFRPIEISFHKTEENFAIEILEYLNKLTGNTKEIKIYPNQGEGRRIRYSNSILSEFLISFMYRDGVKIFPDLTLFNKECVKGFLIGMFYGDGSITKHKNVRNKFKLKSQYIQHLFEYRRYLSVFGIYGSIYQDRGTGCFILELSGQCSDKANELGLYKELYSYQSISKNFNCRSYYIEDEKVYVKVEKISVYEYEGYVYDYTMENIHEYTPNSFVIHNSGGTEYEGGQIKYFRQNLLRTIASDAKTKTLYGDRETKRRLDPVFNPIKYLRNPYRFEEMHQEDMPFPVWGMDVSYGSVLGQLYKGTVGELIKPTVIHPEFLKLQSEANPNLVLGVKGEIAKGISETISGKNSKSLSKLSAGNSEENSDTSVAIVDSDAYTTPENERKEVKSLIADGLMLRANAPTVSVLDRTLAGTSASLSDFTGLKGFSSSLLLGAANLDPTEQLRPELEVSGSSTSFSDTLSDANLGDMLGFGEFSRRLIPQSAAVKRDTVNPMRNQVAPDWLPKNETKYYKNFERGNYYSHMENGEYLLPGSKGFETLNPELKGIDPNNYPLVYQYKILQNVARGSSEHIAVKKYLAEHLDELSEKEKDVFFEAYGQDTERDVQKRFTDYKTGSEKSNMGVIGLTQNAIWESFSHLESPLEPLTPFRPMAKFVHQRTAVEDYIKTQLMGSDVGIWTNPYSHFLKPTLNRLADSGSIDQFKPKEAIEKENVDTYFDKLSLVKAIKTNDTYNIERNITALSYLGINDPGSMKRFKSALPEGQSAYVEAFSQEKDKKKRNQILSLVPKDIGRAYQSIWSNIDIYDQAILRGKDPNKALEEEYLKDSKKLKSAFSIDITRQDKETIHNQASTLANDEDKKRFEQYQEAKLIRLKAAQKEATEYVENQTGSLPSDNWIGWDPRLTIDDIKLKTLTIGREDIHRFGYWQKDLERSERLIGLKEGGIVNELENIKAEKRSNVAREFAIRSRLRNIGFEVSTINSVPSNSNQLKITDKQEYLRAYNNSV